MGILLNNKEKAFFDNRNLEVQRLATTESPVIWKNLLNLPGKYSEVASAIDCIYEEASFSDLRTPTKNVYLPYRIFLIFEQKNKNNEVGDGGRIGRIEGSMYISRKDCEQRKIPLNSNKEHISTGDIIQLWEKNKLRTWYFEVNNVNRDGWQNDSDNFTQYLIDVVRNESFEPERKLLR